MGLTPREASRCHSFRSLVYPRPKSRLPIKFFPGYRYVEHWGLGLRYLLIYLQGYPCHLCDTLKSQWGWKQSRALV